MAQHKRYIEVILGLCQASRKRALYSVWLVFIVEVQIKPIDRGVLHFRPGLRSRGGRLIRLACAYGRDPDPPSAWQKDRAKVHHPLRRDTFLPAGYASGDRYSGNSTPIQPLLLFGIINSNLYIYPSALATIVEPPILTTCSPLVNDPMRLLLVVIVGVNLANCLRRCSISATMLRPPTPTDT